MRNLANTEADDHGRVIDFSEAGAKAQDRKRSWEDQCAAVLIGSGVLEEEALDRATKLREELGQGVDPVLVAQETMAHRNQSEEDALRGL